MTLLNSRSGRARRTPNAVCNAIGYAMHSSRSHDAGIRVYDEAGNVIETCESEGDLKAWQINVAPVSENVHITMTFSLRMRRTVSSLFHQLLLLDLTVRPVQRKASRIAPLSGGGRIENLFFEFAMIFFRDRAPLVLR